MADFTLTCRCPTCDTDTDGDGWIESGDYAECPQCGAWSRSDDVESFDTWTCFNCQASNTEHDETCETCDLSKDASDYLSAG